MKIVFIHYHLKTGGVTTVIKQQIEAIKDDCEVLVITGSPPDNDFPFETVTIPFIAYDNAGNLSRNPEITAQIIYEKIHIKWKDGCDVLHVHNPTIAKNKHFLCILKFLKEKGINLFLQIHDFAEDGRPNYYFPDSYVENSHYGTINSRDYNILENAGLKKEGLHNISNTIHFFETKKKNIKRDNFVLYPIRAIRRKNIGEAILLTLFFKGNEALYITQPPNSDHDIISYDGWRSFVNQNKLNVTFEAGLESDFRTLVQNSKFIITTSITEGFGFSFLEPWTAGKILWGRKIPDICDDFESVGVNLSHLYTNLLVPVDWIGKEKLHDKMLHFYKKACGSFHIRFDADLFEKSFSSVIQNNLIDFGLLDEPFQKNIISNLLTENDYMKRMIELNPFLADPGSVRNNKKLISKNREVINQFFDKEIYRNKLIDIYTKISKEAVHHHIDKQILLSSFLNLKQFHLLKWGEYAE